MKHLPILLLATSSTLAFAQGPAAPQYEVINLGTLGGTRSEAYAINDAGQVVGESYASGNGTLRATLFSGTGSGNINLGTLGGIGSAAYAINNNGQIVGVSRTSTNAIHGVVYSGTGSGNLDLGTLSGTDSYARAINNHGQIAGYASSGAGTGVNNAILFSGTGSGNTNLGTLGGGLSEAIAINNHGQIVGYATSSNDGIYHATLFSGTGSGNTNLGTLSGTRSFAYGINDNGQIVGTATLSGDSVAHATLYSGTGSGNIDLGTLGGTNSYASAINNNGLIVGVSHITGDTAMHGFLYANGVMHDLNDLVAASASSAGISNIRLSINNSINKWGQIAAYGTVAGQGTRALLLNPVTPLSTTLNGTTHATFLAGMDYSKLPTAGTGPNTVSILGGTAGSSGAGTQGLNREVNISITVGDFATYGNIVDLTGTEGDTFVLSLGYDEAALIAQFGNEDKATLSWWDGNKWVNAVAGNDGGTAQFVEGAWNASYTLGTYGIDKNTNTVWAVINHNSEFAITQIPETTTTLLSGMAAIVLCFRRRRM